MLNVQNDDCCTIYQDWQEVIRAHYICKQLQKAKMKQLPNLERVCYLDISDNELANVLDTYVKYHSRKN